jgi:hypothetical protein
LGRLLSSTLSSLLILKCLLSGKRIGAVRLPRMGLKNVLKERLRTVETMMAHQAWTLTVSLNPTGIK